MIRPALPVRVLRVLALAVLALPVLAGARGRDRIPVATPAGAPQTCVNLALLRESFVRSDRVIDFRTTGGRYYRVTLPHDCPGLGFERRFTYATAINRLCAQDIITVLTATPVTRGASCGLGTFQPVTLDTRQ